MHLVAGLAFRLMLRGLVVLGGSGGVLLVATLFLFPFQTSTLPMLLLRFPFLAIFRCRRHQSQRLANLGRLPPLLSTMHS